MSVEICIVEDNAELSESIVGFINGTPGFRCTGAFETGESALQEIPRKKPAVVLMDINLPGMSGIECVARLREVMPSLLVVMLTVYEDSEQVFLALSAGACGYLVKSTPPAKILEAVKDVLAGGSPMSSQIARQVVRSFMSPRPGNVSTAKLSEREGQILDLLAKGWPYKQIAADTNLSMDTVRTYIRRIYEKLHVHSRTEAVVKYLGGPGIKPIR